MPTKTKPSPLETRLLDQKATLLAQIDQVEKDIDAVVLASGTRIATLPSGSLAEESTLRPLQTMRTRLDVLRAAIVDVDKRLGEAPARAQALDAAKKRLADSLALRDVVQSAAEEHLRALHATLLKLSAANRDAYEAAAASYKAWAGAGRLPEQRPSYPAVAWAPDLVRLYKSAAFMDVQLVGDTSGPNVRLWPEAGYDGADFDAELEGE